MRVRVLYDFQAQPDSSELTIYRDEVLTLLDQDIGDGWWEGANDRGERGLFPAGYVETVDETSGSATQQPAPPPPPPPPHQQPAQQQQQQQQQVAATASSDFQAARGQLNNFFAGKPAVQQDLAPAQVHHQPAAEEPDWPDDEWDDDEDSGDNATEYGGPQTSQRGLQTVPPYYGAVQSGAHHEASDLRMAAANLSLADTNKQQAAGGAGALLARKNFSRFSNFVKTGLESFLLDGKAINVPLEYIVHIQNDPELGIVWKPNLNQYTCAVTKHGKETKMKGLKTYISYDITPSTSNIVVRRRYKHFDWLMQRLEEKYIITPLPTLPEKQIAGRFQEDFVEHRRNLLQLWVNYITRHPVLSQCDVWWHFMTCSTDDMKGWKLGKRKAEKDELVGANFFFSVEIDANTTPLDPVKTTKQLDNFQRFVVKLDDAVKHMFSTAVDQSKKFSSIYSKDYKKLSESIKELSSAFQSGTAWRNSLGLNEAIRQTSSAYEDISRLFEEEPKYDFEPMADILHQYRGLLSGWPEILQLHKNTMNLRNEQERSLDEGKISETVMARVNQRANVITYAALAEINHFHNERLVDFKQMMQVFLTAQINFHSDILGKLQHALNKINDA